jgi:hypothetical protein
MTDWATSAECDTCDVQAIQCGQEWTGDKRQWWTGETQRAEHHPAAPWSRLLADMSGGYPHPFERDVGVLNVESLVRTHCLDFILLDARQVP